MSSALERLSKLKKLKMKSEIDNRKEVQKEHESLRTNHKLLERLNEKQEKAQEELDKLESKAKGEDYERKNAWKWTIEQVEKWDEKQKPNEITLSGFQNYKQLAEQTYKKDLKNMEINTDDYSKQKQKFKEYKLKLGIPSEDISRDEELMEKFVVETNNTKQKDKSTKSNVSRLVNRLNEADDRKLKRRRTDDNDTNDKNTIGHINEKNKQFNAKLNRHYDKFTNND